MGDGRTGIDTLYWDWWYQTMHRHGMSMVWLPGTLVRMDNYQWIDPIKEAEAVAVEIMSRPQPTYKEVADELGIQVPRLWAGHTSV